MIDRSTLALPFKPGQNVDADGVMLHACFAVLGQFVEKELGTISWRNGADIYRGYRLHSVDGFNERAIDLWLWYRDDLPVLEKAYRDDLEGAYDHSSKTFPLKRIREPIYPHGYPRKVMNEKLAELMAIREALWT